MSGAGSFDSSNSERVIIAAEPEQLYALAICVHKLWSHMTSTGHQQTPFALTQGFSLEWHVPERSLQKSSSCLISDPCCARKSAPERAMEAHE